MNLENLDLSLSIVEYVRNRFRDIDICVWSGYQYENLLERNDERIYKIFELADVLVDGPFQISCRNVTLKMRGSENQRLIDLNKSTKDTIVMKDYT